MFVLQKKSQGHGYPGMGGYHSVGGYPGHRGGGKGILGKVMGVGGPAASAAMLAKPVSTRRGGRGAGEASLTLDYYYMSL